MKALAISVLLTAPAAVATAQTEQTTEPKKSANIHEFATIAEGKTLPENVIRARAVYKNVDGNGRAYDKDGKKQDSVVDVSANGGAFVLEYGLNDKFSLQFQQDFINSYEVSANKSSSSYADLKQQQFAANAGGARNAGELVQGLANQLAANDQSRQAICGAAAQADCLTMILNGSAKNNAPVAIEKDGLSIAPDANIKQTLEGFARAVDAKIDAGIANSANKSGGKGLADTTLGFIYEAYNTDNLALSVGGGLRFPTGNRDRAANENKTGRGLTEVGVRFNVDYLPVDSFRISWQNQSEAMLAKGEFKVAGQDTTIAREGVRNVGFLVLKPSLASIAEPLKMFGPKLGIAYDYDSEERVKTGNGKETSSGARGQELRYLGNVTASFFDFGVPVQLEVEYRKSFQGKNIAAATDDLTAQIKGYYRF